MAAEILMPYAEPDVHAAAALAPRVPSLSGLTVGIVNNSWRCMHVIADELTIRLRAEHDVADVVEERISAAQTLPQPKVDEMAATCDAVVVGIGN